MEDPFTPQDPQGLDTSGLAQSLAFLDDPKLRSALLSTGIALMQPPSFGDTFPSQLGRAVGAGGESVRTQEAADIKQQEADSKAALREAQAGAAGARADTAGARADTATQRLALEREKMNALNDRNTLGNRVRLSNLYQQYVRDTNKDNVAIAKQNADPLRPRGSEPTPLKTIDPIEDWVAKNPSLRSSGLIPQQSVDAGMGEGSAMDAPQDPAQRKPGLSYNTPQGVLKWTGSGWVRP